MSNTEYKQDLEAYELIREHKDMFITLELCLLSAELRGLKDPNVVLRRCLKSLKKRLKHERNRDVVQVLREDAQPARIMQNWLKTGDEKHEQFDILISEMDAKLASNTTKDQIMEIEKHEFFHIRMHSSEAEKLLDLLEEVASDQTMPAWAKKRAESIAKDLKNCGVTN